MRLPPDRFNRRPHASTLLVCLGMAAATPGRARPAEPRQNPIVESVEVNLVNVDVVVSDKQGKPVSGLRREDFELLEDGRPVEITHFYRVEGGRAGASQADSQPAGRPAERPPEEETVSTPEDQRLRLVIFVDNRNLDPGNRNAVFERLHDFLRLGLGPESRVAIVTHDQSLKIQRPFTDNAEFASLDFFDLETAVGRRIQAEAERRSLIRQMEQTAPERVQGDIPEVRELLERIRHYARGEYQQVVSTLDALRKFVDSLGGVPGRKAILYVSDGLPMSPGKVLFDAFQNKFNAFAMELKLGSPYLEGNLDATQKFREVVARANANRVTFYTIDAAGRQRNLGTSAEDVGSVDTRALDTPGGGRVWTADIATTQEQDIRSAFAYLAGRTGGLSLVRNSSLASRLRQVAGDFAVSYSLAYTPPHSGDGKFHRIEVRVRRPGVTVRSREGYQDKTPDERETDRVLSALLLGVADNPLGVEVEAGRERSGRGDSYVLPLLVKVPMSKLALVPGPTDYRGRLSIFVAVRDGRGRISDVQKREIPVHVSRERMAVVRNQLAGHVVRLAIRPGFQTIVVGVRDDLAATHSTVQLDVRIGND